MADSEEATAAAFHQLHTRLTVMEETLITSRERGTSGVMTRLQLIDNSLVGVELRTSDTNQVVSTWHAQRDFDGEHDEYEDWPSKIHRIFWNSECPLFACTSKARSEKPVKKPFRTNAKQKKRVTCMTQWPLPETRPHQCQSGCSAEPKRATQ